MQDSAEKEDKPAILRETIHNLALSEETGSLWFLDNESSFLDAVDPAQLLLEFVHVNEPLFAKFIQLKHENHGI